MRAVKLPAQVNRDHTLHLQLPEEIQEGPAEVIVLIPEPKASPQIGRCIASSSRFIPPGRHLIDMELRTSCQCE